MLEHPRLDTAERILFGALLALLVWLPLPMGSNRDWAVGLFILSAGLLAAIWSAVQLVRREPLGTGFRRALLPLGLLLATQVWVAIQWVGGLSQDPGSTFQYLMLGIGYCLLYLLVAGLVRTRKRISILLGVLVFSGVFQAFFGTFMTLSGMEWLVLEAKQFHVGHATGTFVNRNHLAGYLELAMAAGIGLLMALRDGGRFRWARLIETIIGPKMRVRLGLVIMVIALVMSHSRMGNTAFFASLLIVGGAFVLIDRENRLRNSLILASIIVIDIVIISQYFGLDQLKDRLVNTRLNDVVVDGNVVLEANEYRGLVVQQALPLARENPLTGQGAGSFEAVFPPYAGSDIPLHYDHAHNDFLQFFIEFGLIGSLPLALFVGISMFYAIRAMRQRQSLYRSGLGFGTAIGILSLMIHSSTDFNLQIPANAATYIVLCAVAVTANYHRVDRGADGERTAGG
ncbi:O-antigen ligase family protein [Halopseudomonas nanhaiensis]|uniref:O-antigen ligase family protein n=1 Tax=Halopseudomonas nanhaiensis TaxID=2830842 RepID=UPI001CBF2A63|nr:O-antigen ligase family protein [Halopseudomonas nanhaiensis]UAW98051.1 O-antigen ligase family protein [Halopseudomonas nanhaiensis]